MAVGRPDSLSPVSPPRQRATRRSQLKAAVIDRLAGRDLVWFGTRGADAEALADLPNLTSSFSIIAAYHNRERVASLALEDVTGVRVDLDAYEIDDELATEPVTQFRRQILRALNRDSVVVTYRPSTLMSAACFARSDRCEYAGMFKGQQEAFEHKPWVETSIRRLGMPAIPWIYVSDDDQVDSMTMIDHGPVVLRRSRSSGGSGIVRANSRQEVVDLWPRDEEAYVSVAPFIEGGLPINIAGVVWANDVTLHPASVQLIGLPLSTTRPFGYCGNDFGLIASYPRRVLETVDFQTRGVGRWLQVNGYRGAFGVDYLVTADERVLFMEVNPRLQGSTHSSCRLMIEQGLPDILLEHLAAGLGLSPVGESMPLTDIEAAIDLPFAQLILHNTTGASSRIDETGLATRGYREPGTVGIDLIPTDVSVNANAAIGRVLTRQRLTTTGFDLAGPWAGIADEVQRRISA